MKSKFLSMLFILLIVIVSACGGAQETVENRQTGEPEGETENGENKIQSDVKTFKIVANAADLHREMAEEFARLIEEKSDGSLQADLYLDGQLGTNDEDLSTGIAEGGYEIFLGSDMMANWVAPDWLGFANIPFAFNGMEHVQAFWNSDIGDEVNERMIEEQDVRILTEDVAVRGARHVTANKPVKTVEDMKGLNFRTPNIPAVVASWEAAGANITPVPFGELFGALQTGVVDAQENPFEQISQLGLYEVQDYVMLTGHQYGVHLTHIYEDWWESLTEEERNIIQEANKEANEYYNNGVSDLEDKVKEEIQNAGAEIIETNELDIKSFKDVIIPTVLEKFGDEWAENGWGKIQKLQ